MGQDAEPAPYFFTPTPTNDNTIPIKTTKDDDDEGSRNNAECKLAIIDYVKEGL